MGLAVEVGLVADLAQHDAEGALWIRESFEKVNTVLAEHNLPSHVEPEELPPLDDRSVICGFPYSFLHYLRRAYARWRQNPSLPITPCGEDEDPSADPAIADEVCMLDSHLLCHSDCDGFYLPIPFTEILIDEKDQERIPGGLLGSSYQLAEELKSMAPSLGIHLRDGQLTDEVADMIQAKVESKSALWIECGVWLTLFEAARLSIQHKTAICFC